MPVNSFFFTQLDFGILCQQNAFVWFMICEALLSFGLFLINFPVFRRVPFLVNPCLVVAFQFLVELIPIKKIQNLDSALVQTLLTARWKIVAFRTSARLSALFMIIIFIFLKPEAEFRNLEHSSFTIFWSQAFITDKNFKFSWKNADVSKSLEESAVCTFWDCICFSTFMSNNTSRSYGGTIPSRRALTNIMVISIVTNNIGIMRGEWFS